MQFSSKVFYLLIILFIPFCMLGVFGFYYGLSYYGPPCSRVTSPDGRYVVEKRAKFNMLNPICSTDETYVRLRTAAGKIVREADAYQFKSNISWDDEYDVVKLEPYSQGFYWLLDPPPHKVLPPFYLQHRLNVAVDSEGFSDVKRLVKQGADINGLDERGNLPLVNATSNRNLPVVKYLVAHGAQINGRDGHGITALHYSQVMNTGDNTVSPLTIFLLEHGADINSRDSYGRTPLHWGARTLADVQYLVEHGANVNALDDDGRPPLSNYSKDFPTVQYLLAHGTKIDYHSAWVPEFVYQAIIDNSLELVKFFEAHGADMQAALAVRYMYPLHFSAENQHFVMVKYLVEHGMDVNEKDKKGKTPLIVTQEALAFDYDIDSYCYNSHLPSRADCDPYQVLHAIADYLVQHGAREN